MGAVEVGGFYASAGSEQTAVVEEIDEDIHVGAIGASGVADFGGVGESLFLEIETACDKPIEDSRGLSAEFMVEVFVLAVFGYGDIERDEGDSTPDGVVRAMDNREMVAAHKDFMSGSELEVVLPHTAGDQVIASGEFFDGGFCEALSEFDFGGDGESEAFEVGECGWMRVVSGSEEDVGRQPPGVAAHDEHKGFEESGFAVGS